LSAKAGIDQLKNWFQKIKSPVTLHELGIPPTDIPKIAENSLALAKVWRLPEYDQQSVEEILHLCR